MNASEMMEQLAETPIIAAVKDESGLKQCLGSDAKVVFILYGTVVDIPAIVQRVHQAGRAAIVHMDLIDGLSARESAADYIRHATLADGIISTKAPLIRRAHELGLITIRRFFLLDSMALHALDNQLAACKVDFIEILPGLMPKILKQITSLTALPVIAGGLINDKEDVVNALSAGAMAVSTTKPDIWFLN